MNSHHGTPSSSSTFPEDAEARAGARQSPPATTEQAARKATRPWFKKKLTSPPTAQAVAADIGTKVRDGTFEFVVTGVERPGKTLAGKVGSTLTAQGEFVIVRVDVTNISSKEQRLGCSCQFLFSDKGRQFTPSPAVLSTKDALKYVQWINPGATVKDASMLFDVTPGTKAANIELHDSPSSRGVMVKLS
jgi:hypothetical protein